MNVILCSFTVFLFVYVCTEQPRTTWCVTSCVRTQGVGVPAQTNASPANTLAEDEPVWIPVIFMKGELCLSMHTYTLMQQHRHPGRLHCASQINGWLSEADGALIEYINLWHIGVYPLQCVYNNKWKKEKMDSLNVNRVSNFTNKFFFLKNSRFISKCEPPQLTP